MKHQDFKSMSADELWSLHEEAASELVRRITAEKVRLDRRLCELGATKAGSSKNLIHARRPYPRVFPKYRNPKHPEETWAGRGKQPRWLKAQLSAGKKLDDFRIPQSSNRARRSAK